MTTELMYRIKVLPGGRKLGYREKGGAKYTNYKAAMGQLIRLRRSGVKCDLYEAEVVWRCVDADVPDNMDTLF